MHAQQKSNTELTMKHAEKSIEHSTPISVQKVIPFVVSSELTRLNLGYCSSQGGVERILTQRRPGTSIIEHCMDFGAQMLGEQGNTLILVSSGSWKFCTVADIRVSER